MKAIFILFFVVGVSLQKAASSSHSVPPETCQLNSLNDMTLSKERLKDCRFSQPVVIVFLSSACPCSTSHQGHLIDLARKFTNFQFLGLHADSQVSESIARDFFRAQNFPFPVLIDKEFLVSKALDALVTPHAFVFSKEGIILYQGAVTSSAMFSENSKQYLHDTLKAVSNKKSPPQSSRRPFGCFLNYARPRS